MTNKPLLTPLATLLVAHPCIGEFLASLGLVAPDASLTLGRWLAQLPTIFRGCCRSNCVRNAAHASWPWLKPYRVKN